LRILRKNDRVLPLRGGSSDGARFDVHVKFSGGRVGTRAWRGPRRKPRGLLGNIPCSRGSSGATFQPSRLFSEGIPIFGRYSYCLPMALTSRCGRRRGVRGHCLTAFHFGGMFRNISETFLYFSLILLKYYRKISFSGEISLYFSLLSLYLIYVYE
jgi:hypothetical protein